MTSQRMAERLMALPKTSLGHPIQSLPTDPTNHKNVFKNLPEVSKYWPNPKEFETSLIEASVSSKYYPESTNSGINEITISFVTLSQYHVHRYLSHICAHDFGDMRTPFRPLVSASYQWRFPRWSKPFKPYQLCSFQKRIADAILAIK